MKYNTTANKESNNEDAAIIPIKINVSVPLETTYS